MNAPTLARAVLWLTIIAGLGLVVFTDPGVDGTGCSVDHTAVSDEKKTTVKVCDDLNYNGKVVSGLSYAHNDTIKVERNVYIERVYVHELGHQSGFRHENGTIMDAYVNRDLPSCGLEATEKKIAHDWDTLEIKQAGPCKFIQTPYGQVW